MAAASAYHCSQRPFSSARVSCCTTGDFIEDDDGEYGADMGEEDDFFNGDGDKGLSGKKRKDGAGKGAQHCFGLKYCGCCAELERRS